MWFQKTFTLPPKARGFHLIDSELQRQLDAIGEIEIGLLHLFLQHTSASLSLNENADPSVRRDFARYFDRAVPDGAAYFEHQDEGPDDMPAHIKASLLGAELTLPVRNGRLALGTWQGVYLCEHRDRARGRSLVMTLMGQSRSA